MNIKRLIKKCITEKYNFDNRLVDSSKEILATLFADLHLQITDNEDELELETEGLRISDAEDNDEEDIMIIE